MRAFLIIEARTDDEEAEVSKNLSDRCHCLQQHFAKLTESASN